MASEHGQPGVLNFDSVPVICLLLSTFWNKVLCVVLNFTFSVLHRDLNMCYQ